MKNTIALYTFVFGFIIAIFTSSFFQLGISFSFLLIFLSIIIFIFRKFLLMNQEEKIKILYVSLLLLSFGLGTLRYEIRDLHTPDQNLETAVGKSITVEGLIVEEPQRKEKQAVFIVDMKNILEGSSNIAVSDKAIISTDLYPEFQYGDLIQISGTLKKPENFISSSSKDFDYISYLAKDDIFYKIVFAKVILVSSGNGNTMKAFLFQIKNAFMNNINRSISEPEASLLSGVLLGAKTSLDTSTTDTFRIAGLSHIIALSGYNITIIAKGVMDILSFLPKTVASSFGIVSVILFVLMSGGTSTAVRAGIMSVIALTASITHRKYDIGRALIIALFVMVFINPKILVFDVSFQLSFLATIAIIYVSPILKKKLHFITERFGLRDIVATTLSAQILVLPLILYKMGLLSLVALPANVFVLAFIPIIMFFGFITGALTFLWLPLSLPFAWISYIFLAYIIYMARFFAGLPGSYINITWFSAGMMTICYILMGTWIIKQNKRVK